MNDISEIRKKIRSGRSAIIKWQGIQSEIEEMIAPFCDFEFFVDVVAGDGIVLGNYDTSIVRDIDDVVAHIKMHGSLTSEEHENL